MIEANISVKEQLAVIIQQDGYDFCTALEHAAAIIDRFKLSDDKETKLYSRTTGQLVAIIKRK